MARHRKLIGIALIAFLIGGSTGFTVQATSSPVAIARAKLAEGLTVAEALGRAEASRQTCTDLKKGTFEWRWANVPFASSCAAQSDMD